MKKSHKSLVTLLTFMSDKQFHDGTTIGAHMGITRAAVWKLIKRLQAYGVPIHSVKGKGYLLDEPLFLLDAAVIKPLLTRAITLDVLEEVGSTNDYLREHSTHTITLPHACIAERQTRGKGRFDRSWYSPFGKNVYLSLRYTSTKDISEWSGLSLVVGLAVCSAIETLTPLLERLTIKWPNDILLANQKCAGILIDIHAQPQGLCELIIGVGVNVNMANHPDIPIDQAWTSLHKQTCHYFNRNVLCAAIINQLLSYLQTFEREGLAAFLEEWRTRDALYGKNVTLAIHQTRLQGICNGVNTQGHLQLTLNDGSEKTFSSGEASLLKPSHDSTVK